MFVSCWSAKGGSGTTVVAAALAVSLSHSCDAGVLAIDLAGDLPAVMGLPEPSGPGVAEWLAAGDEVPPDGLSRIEVPVGPGLALVARGRAALSSPARAEVLAGVLGAEARTVVVDCGVLGSGGAEPDRREESREVAHLLAAAATHSLLVTRACYLSLRRVVAGQLRPSGVVVLREPGRSLDVCDIEEVVGVDVVAEIPVDSAVARAVDAGLLAQRLPRSLSRAIRDAA